MITPEIKKQLDKPIHWLVKYFPRRIQNVNAEQAVTRQFVLNFKDGNILESNLAAVQIAYYMKRTYGPECKNIVFTCVPASSREKYSLRFRDFSSHVCRLTSAMNGYSHIHVLRDRIPVHESGNESDVRETANVLIDEHYFRGKKVVCFDDVITRGLSFANFACALESQGASVIGGLFLARTHYNTKRN